MRIRPLSKDASQVNFSNSILKHFNAETFHDSYKPLDEILEKNKGRKIVLFLFDGFGKQIQEATKDCCPFIYSHGLLDLNTVYPPTTVAATTAVLSGKYPVETGWLGWTLYNPDTNEHVDTFFGINHGLNTAANFVPSRDLPYQSIFELIDKAQGSHCTDRIDGFNFNTPKGHPDIHGFMSKLQEDINNPSLKFIYAYWTDPDHTLHNYGVDSEAVRHSVKEIDKCVKRIVEANKDVLFLSIADHGHIICQWVDIRNYPDFMDTLIDGRVGLEARFASFRVKKGREQDFIKAYNKYFSKDFALYTKEEILKEHVFGYAEPNKITNKLIGDYYLIGTSNKALGDLYSPYDMLSHHAGSLPIETDLKIGVYNSK